MEEIPLFVQIELRIPVSSKNMKGKFNINKEELVQKLIEQGKKDRELFTLTPEQEAKFRTAAKILAQNKKDCECFKGRDGI